MMTFQKLGQKVPKPVNFSRTKNQNTSRIIKNVCFLKRMAGHPNIVRFQEVFMTRKGRLCIVMDYCDGGDVHQEITNVFYSPTL